MGAFKPNNDQQKFIDSVGHNVLVSASAGSGKTSTMINKLVLLMHNNKVPIINLLVVTYTNASASELKTKLSTELSALISSNISDEDREFLTRQLDNISNAEIGTLHSTCKKLIVKYFYNLNQSPDFTLVLEKEQKYLLDMAVKNVFSKKIQGNDEQFFDLYDCYNAKRSDVTLEKMCENLYNFKVAKVDYDEWVQKTIESSYNTDWNVSEPCQYLREFHEKELLNFSKNIFSLKKTAKDLDLEKYFLFLDSRNQFIDEFCSAKNYETAVKVLFNAKFPSKPTKSDKMTAEQLDFDEEVNSFKEDFDKLLKAVKKDFVTADKDVFDTSILKSKQNLQTLLGVVNEIEAEYSRLKFARNALDFNDLEDKMLELLKIDAVREELRQQYKFVFVDEYQDINEKQETILQSLVSLDNYYMIGDVKQSIYGFRQSSPKIFVSKYNSFGKNGDSGEVINFNQNYRSDKNILEFNNSVFEKIITNATIGIDYTNARFISNNVVTGTKVDMCLLNTAEDLDDKEVYEAQIVADEIARLLCQKKSDGTNFEYKDIAVILRSRGTFVKTLQTVLSMLRIPIRGSVKNNYFTSPEVGEMLAILRSVSNVKDDLSDAIVLKNLFGVTDQELLNIRTSSESSSFWDCISMYYANDELKAKISAFLQFIEDSKKALLTKTIKEYLSDIIARFDILLKLKLKPNGNEAISNVREFLMLADNENYKYSVEKFLEYVDFISKEETTRSIGSASNAVEICTVHHSKGLEYPAVIVCGLGKKFNINKDTSDIIMSERFGIGLKYVDSTSRSVSENVVRNAIKQYNKKSEIDEEIRLLYVALTRAKERLSLVGAYNLDDILKQKRKSTNFANCNLDLIFKSIDSVYASSFKNKKNFTINQGKDDVADVKIYSLSDFEELIDTEDDSISFSGENAELVDTLNDVYSNAPSTKTATIKNTVTSILADELDYENLNFVPKKLSPQDAVLKKDVLSLGTAYHSIMQSIKFTENEAEIRKIIDTQIASGQIDKNLKDHIKISDILKAIKVLSPIILSADKVYREKQFLLQENYNKLVEFTDNNTKVIVQGVIDLAVVTGDKVFIIDYKTNRGVTEQFLKDEYRVQLAIYSLAFENATGKKVTNKYLYSFSLGKLIEVE